MKLRNIKRSILSTGALASVALPMTTAVSCSIANEDPIYTIKLDSFYKHAPYWDSVIEAVEEKFENLGIEQFEIEYTQQNTEGLTKDRMKILGFTDPQMPDIMRLNYGDISEFSNQQMIMPFTDEMLEGLSLDVEADPVAFAETWGSHGVDDAIRRDEYDRVGQQTGEQVVVGMPYSINSSVMMVRNAIVGTNPFLTDGLTAAEVVTPEGIAKLNALDFIDATTSASTTAANFTRESATIPESYAEMVTYTNEELASASGTPVIDQYGYHVYMALDDYDTADNPVAKGDIVRWQGDKSPIGYIVNGLTYSSEDEVEAATGLSSADYLTTSTPTFFSRNDLWSELGQFLGSAMENDLADDGQRTEFFWKTVENPTEADQWNHLFNEEYNPGAMETWRYMYDSLKVQSQKDESWFDPLQAIDTSFYNMTNGSRTFPITGIWDLGIAERKFAMYVLGLNTDQQLADIVEAAAGNAEAKAALDNILDKATTTLPLTDFVGYNDENIEPFMQISSLVVNNRIQTNPGVWNPSVRGNDGNAYSKQDAITMILDEFVNGDHAVEALNSEMVVPVNQDMIDASQGSNEIESSAYNANNFKEYIAAQGEILETAPAGPKYQFYYSLQGRGQDAMSNNRDLAVAIQSTTEEIEGFLKEQADAGIVADPELIANSSSINLPTKLDDDKRFEYWYNLIQAQLTQLISDQWTILYASGKEFY